MRVAKRARKRLYMRETHLWYQLALARERPRRPLAPGLELVEGGPETVHLLAELPALRVSKAQQRLADGARLWFVLDDGRAVFACWIFGRAAPTIAARGGSLNLPAGVCCLEDSLTSPLYRGRGVAPAAWSDLLDRLSSEGVEDVITKVGAENVPSCRAVAKSGFQHFATMSLVRVAGHRSVRFNHGGGDVGRHMEQQLTS